MCSTSGVFVSVLIDVHGRVSYRVVVLTVFASSFIIYFGCDRDAVLVLAVSFVAIVALCPRVLVVLAVSSA